MRLRTIGLATLLLAFAGASHAGDAAVVRRAGDAGVSLGTGDFVQLSPRGSTAVSQLRLTEKKAYRTPLHVHPNTDETFYVLSGELTLHVDGQTRVLKTGDYAFIPRGTPHAQGNTTDTPVTVLLSMSPGAFEAFFWERVELVKTTPPGHPAYGERMMDLGNRHDIKVLGPPPF